MIPFVIVISCLSLAFAVFLARQVMQKDTGTPKMREISDAIKEGAEAFLSRQNRTISQFVRGLGGADLRPLCLRAHAEHGRSGAACRVGLLDHARVRPRCGLFGDRRLRRHVGFDPRQYPHRLGGAHRA